MHDLFRDIPGEFLATDAMHADYEKRFAAPGGLDSWKLERRQHFRDPQFASWEAFDRGEWAEALRLLEKERPNLAELRSDTITRGIDLYRVRVVEEPIVPYLQWELHLLALRAEYGEKIRIVGPEAIDRYESSGELPELLTVGTETVYEFRYDETGTLIGASRYEDPDIYTRCTDLMREVYAVGEDMSSFFDRRVTTMDPPERR
ncbi:hypothetical protein ABIA39_008089 [Nocardia sp. GAS34]|uniref:DUF6879 family protein n=1 Tax=unclassified Nocardia TaxID=2637762 RepID=UPI003D1F9730